VDLRGKVAVVTGGGSGIGRAVCATLAARGATLAVCDLDGAAAQETLERAPGSPDGHGAFVVDVSDRRSVAELTWAVEARFGRADVLVNNAGVLGPTAPLEELSDETFDWIMDIDLGGVVNMTRAFLPMLKARPEAVLVNVSSLAGLMGALGNAAYFTAKFGVRGFTETMRAELRTTSVRTVLVHPGIVKTGLAGNNPTYSEAERLEAVRRYQTQRGVTPELAASRIVAAIERGKPRLLIGADCWVADKLVRLVPSRYDRVFGDRLRALANAQRPDGRKVF
jgi:NAD(P)-dependent dehydrogenase (short-subunit alcohol dehydrogenase family)